MGAIHRLRSSVPQGVSGDWRVEKFEVSEEQARFECLRASIGGSSRYIEPGEYTRLMRNRTVVMSDTPAEMDDHVDFAYYAQKDVLINGLGLGMAVKIALSKPEVTSVTVIEISPDVIKLVAPHIADDRLTVVNADALEWKPPKGKRYGAVWHDIWDYICGNNLPDMRRLHRRYGRRTQWQGSWARDLIRD